MGKLGDVLAATLALVKRHRWQRRALCPLCIDEVDWDDDWRWSTFHKKPVHVHCLPSYVTRGGDSDIIFYLENGIDAFLEHKGFTRRPQ